MLSGKLFQRHTRWANWFNRCFVVAAAAVVEKSTKSHDELVIVDCMQKQGKWLNSIKNFSDALHLLALRYSCTSAEVNQTESRLANHCNPTTVKPESATVAPGCTSGFPWFSNEAISSLFHVSPANSSSLPTLVFIQLFYSAFYFRGRPHYFPRRRRMKYIKHSRIHRGLWL